MTVGPKGTRSKERRQNGRRSENDTGVARMMQTDITRKRLQKRTETKQNYAKKPNRISVSGIITDRRDAHVLKRKTKNKCGCNI